MQKSTKKSVFLTNVNLNTRGKYRCEISAEAPSFVTAAKEGNLEINGKYLENTWKKHFWLMTNDKYFNIVLVQGLK